MVEQKYLNRSGDRCKLPPIYHASIYTNPIYISLKAFSYSFKLEKYAYKKNIFKKYVSGLPK